MAIEAERAGKELALLLFIVSIGDTSIPFITKPR